MMLTALGWGAPSSDEIISAEFTYGGAGTCQSATIRPVNTYAGGRAANWEFRLGGWQVFQGIPDGISDADGQLAQISLMAPHRPRLGGLGESLAGVQAGPFETLSAALERELGSMPEADIGIRPDGTEVAEVPGGGGSVGADETYEVRYIGPAYPDAVTDAVFDPGDGWRKYAYKRDCPPYALRRTASAKADPAIITKEETGVPVTRVGGYSSPVTTGEVTHYFSDLIEADGVERMYAEKDSTKTETVSDVGNWTFSTPKDTDVRRNQKVKVRCPFLVTAIAAYPPPVPVVFVSNTGGGDSGGGSGETPDPIKPAPTNEELAQRLDAAENRVFRIERQTQAADETRRTPRGTPRFGELKLLISLYLMGDDGDQVLDTTAHVFKEQDIALEQAVSFEVGKVGEGANFRVRYELIEQDTGRSLTIAFRPLEVAIEYTAPNVEGVQMPEGWEKPFVTEARHEVRVPGWHIPPLTVLGQPAASAVVTWNRGECSTLITTGALGYG
ncbi:hypothetical protein [Deinococcus radiodurans]|nr:hypothetical protein [Deinococcus radiodurans]ANC72968.1 hypothetical protein A2G07_14030 [Deinococcus radiodurans R1 = ATCC 13939 = DSM 20539]QIP30392.1 hypothetical protein HAV23_14160 [Deinococcus radiodurans]QIP33251.1 hypothetical protein HAV35_13840 [Deinococcus radiodurans]